MCSLHSRCKNFTSNRCPCQLGCGDSFIFSAPLRCNTQCSAWQVKYPAVLTWSLPVWISHSGCGDRIQQGCQLGWKVLLFLLERITFELDWMIRRRQRWKIQESIPGAVRVSARALNQEHGCIWSTVVEVVPGDGWWRKGPGGGTVQNLTGHGKESGF